MNAAVVVFILSFIYPGWYEIVYFALFSSTALRTHNHTNSHRHTHTHSQRHTGTHSHRHTLTQAHTHTHIHTGVVLEVYMFNVQLFN